MRTCQPVTTAIIHTHTVLMYVTQYTYITYTGRMCTLYICTRSITMHYLVLCIFIQLMLQYLIRISYMSIILYNFNCVFMYVPCRSIKQPNIFISSQIK